MNINFTVALPGGLDDFLRVADGTQPFGVAFSSDGRTKVLVIPVPEGSNSTSGITQTGNDFIIPVVLGPTSNQFSEIQAVDRQFTIAGPDYLPNANALLTAPNGDTITFSFISASGGN